MRHHHKRAHGIIGATVPDNFDQVSELPSQVTTQPLPSESVPPAPFSVAGLPTSDAARASQLKDCIMKLEPISDPAVVSLRQAKIEELKLIDGVDQSPPPLPPKPTSLLLTKITREVKSKKRQLDASNKLVVDIDSQIDKLTEDRELAVQKINDITVQLKDLRSREKDLAGSLAHSPGETPNRRQVPDVSVFPRLIQAFEDWKLFAAANGIPLVEGASPDDMLTASNNVENGLAAIAAFAQKPAESRTIFTEVEPVKHDPYTLPPSEVRPANVASEVDSACDIGLAATFAAAAAMPVDSASPFPTETEMHHIFTPREPSAVPSVPDVPMPSARVRFRDGITSPRTPVPTRVKYNSANSPPLLPSDLPPTQVKAPVISQGSDDDEYDESICSQPSVGQEIDDPQILEEMRQARVESSKQIARDSPRQARLSCAPLAPRPWPIPPARFELMQDSQDENIPPNQQALPTQKYEPDI